MKKVIFFLMGLGLIMGLTPIFAGGGSQSAASASSSGGGPKEVVAFMEQGQIPDEFIDTFFADFEKTNNIDVNWINGGLDSVYRQNLAVALNGGQAVDILYCNGQGIRRYANRNIIADLTNLVPYWDRFHEGAVNQITFAGKRFGVPGRSGNTSGVFYNTDILKKYNLQPPKTYDDLLKMKDVLAKDNISVFGFGGGDKYMWPMWFMCAFNQTTGNKAIARTEATLRGQAKFTDKDYVDAMAILARMGNDGLFQPGFNGMDRPQGYAVFSSGRSALFYGGIWVRQGFRDSGMTNNMGIIHFPVVVSGAKPEVTGTQAGGYYCLINNLPADRQKVGLMLLDYGSSDKQMQARADYMKDYGPTANKNFNIPATADPLLIGAIRNDLLPMTVQFLDWVWPPEIVTAFQDQIQAVTGNQATPEAALANIQRVFDDLVKNGYNFDATN